MHKYYVIISRKSINNYFVSILMSMVLNVQNIFITINKYEQLNLHIFTFFIRDFSTKSYNIIYVYDLFYLFFNRFNKYYTL